MRIRIEPSSWESACDLQEFAFEKTKLPATGTFLSLGCRDITPSQFEDPRDETKSEIKPLQDFIQKTLKTSRVRNNRPS